MEELLLVDKLCHPTRPAFLLGDVPPKEGTPPGDCQRICNKFMTRSRALASDGFIVYDIQDEPGRAGEEQKRPFPFRKLMDSSVYGALLSRTSGKECLVYKCIADENLDGWLNTCNKTHGHSTINLVGRPSSTGSYSGPTMTEAMNMVSTCKLNLKFGCVCIAERHTLEAAKLRGKDYPTEHLNMVRKVKAGCQWFVSQAVYDVEPTIRLLRDYAALCKQEGITKPPKVLLTFAPVSRQKTMDFIQWLGVRVPQDAQTTILSADKPAEASIDYLCTAFETILKETAGLGIPLGISCESVSIYKAEIDAVHQLFQRLQGRFLDSKYAPWKVIWIENMPPSNTADDENDYTRAIIPINQSASTQKVVISGFCGVLLGGAMVAAGVMTGALARQKR